jgi:MATE family multidrug resistance protein|tara:strand:+ start:41742 stop:43070 length:1329 start_codon:yes stop_codon:yes gene_type:complete
MLDYRYKTILAIALPVMGASFIQSIVMITDASFLSRYSTLAFDASGNAGLIYVTLFVALMGIGDGSQIVFARRIGQKQFSELGSILGTTVWTNLLLASFLFIVIQLFMSDALLSYSKHQDLAIAQGRFIEIRSFGLFFAVFTLSVNAYLFASGQTGKVLIASIVTALSNVILDYGLIFGNIGLPEMGLDGAAWASTIADGLGMICILALLVASKKNREIGLLKNLGFKFKAMQTLFRIGSPMMLQGFLALSTWTVFFTLIEQIGKFELTVSQNIRVIYMLAFVPIWGFAATTKTYVSQYLGGDRKNEIAVIQKRVRQLTMLFLFLIFHGALFYPETLIKLINPDPLYIKESAKILRMVSPSIFLFGFVNVYYQTINGSGNTNITLYIESICVILYLTCAYLFIKVLNFPIFYIWTVEYVYFGSLGLMSYMYLKRKVWHDKII